VPPFHFPFAPARGIGACSPAIQTMRRAPETMHVAEWIEIAVALYAAVGLVFASAFAVAGVGVVDPAAARATPGFRLVAVPGATLLWPLLAVRWVRGDGPAVERTAHRAPAGGREEAAR
jgi:hypothetical protein